MHYHGVSEGMHGLQSASTLVICKNMARVKKEDEDLGDSYAE
jgi:hypothetical protein